MATQEQINFCNSETHKHCQLVRRNINLFVSDLQERGLNHDATKFEEPELSIFAENTHKLGGVVYGSPEYKALSQDCLPAITHHYAKNRHHPEHWPDGIENMTLIDLVEMIADWKAATQRNKDGNIRKSIEMNAAKYKMSPQLRTIFENTVREYFKE